MIKRYIGVVRKYRRFGWLIGSQALVFLMSISGFGILARFLGPDPFARFAFILLVYTVVSLLTDFTSQSFILVNGSGKQARYIAWLLSVGSAIAGVSLLFVTMLVTEAWNLVRISPVELGLLCIALIAQVVMQVPRATSIIFGQYRSIAFADVAGVAVGVGASIWWSQTDHPGLTLVLQLAVTASVKTVILVFASPRNLTSDLNDKAIKLKDGIKFALRVVPLNTASYLARSLDSGLLPSIVPTVAAAGYARSYQVVIAPVTQIQIALGSVILNKLSMDFSANNGLPGKFARTAWMSLRWISFSASTAIIVLSSGIKFVLFGQEWGAVDITIAAMAVLIPGIAIGAYGSWTAQIVGDKKRTWGHVFSVLTTPVTVVTVASILGFESALISLMISGGLVQPVLLCLVHRQSIPSNQKKVIIRIFFQWIFLCTVFYLVHFAGF